MIRMDGVSFSYRGGGTALREVDLRVGPGELAVLTGPSGSGKTTVGRVINGLAGGFYPGTLAGELRLAGRSAAALAPWERAALAGSVFQDPCGQFVAETVLGELAFGCECLGLGRAETVRRAYEAAELFSLAGQLELSPTDLSGGERQRLSAASAWAAGPPVLVLDEPTANLDREGVCLLAQAVGLVKASGRAVVVAEHRLGWLAGLADSYLYFRDGRLEREMAPSELLSLLPGELRRLGLRDPLPDGQFGRDAPVGPGCPGFSDAQGPASEGPSPGIHACRGLAAESLGLRRGRREVFRGVSLGLGPGELKALTGPNGAGKTSLGRILCGLARETAGRVLWDGRPLRPGGRARRASMVASEPQGQLLGDTAENELRLSGADGPDALAILEELGLGPSAARHPFALSGGQRQKLVVASASLRPQPSIFLDEPTSGLDLANMSLVASFLRRLADSGRAIIVATHDMELVGECHAPTIPLPRRA